MIPPYPQATMKKIQYYSTNGHPERLDF
ncbi:MAG: hypothetical protein METHAR1v1_1710002, partial [Methanothrix sp.]